MEKLHPDPTMRDWKTLWRGYLVDKVKENTAQGIINLFIKYCPPHLCYYPDIRRRFIEEGIPEIMLELEHEVVSIEQIRTRLMAFIEVIRGDI